MPIPVLILVGGAGVRLVGFGMGYLTLRLRGAFFAIATWRSRSCCRRWSPTGISSAARAAPISSGPAIGAAHRRLYPISVPGHAAAGGGAMRRALIEHSARLRLRHHPRRRTGGRGGGVPTLRLKLIATTLSGALMGMAGAPLPYYVTYLDPASGFSLAYAVNSIAMPLIGGTASWIGPLIGAVCSAPCSRSRP
jgi:branched-chain amino acid transport system permease protein